jgi:galactokinase
MIEIFVPGRLCLFGEHSDWAGALRQIEPGVAPGACIVTGTDQGITATVEPSHDFELTSRLPDGGTRGPYRLPMHGPALRAAARAGSFVSYAAGAAAELWDRFQPPGVRLNVVRMDLPIARGLSSSAAICVAVARAFNLVHGLGLDVRTEMEIAYRGEVAAGSLCGRMDQACAYGRRVVVLGFDGGAMSVEPLRPARGLALLIVDLQHAKNTRRILADLNTVFRTSGDPRQALLRHALGPANLDLCRRARAALSAGDAAALGALMVEAQALFDDAVLPACPSELRAPRLHAVLSHPAARDLAWGGKGVGSQGDGAAQLVCRGAEARSALIRELARTADVRCWPLDIVAEAGRTEPSSPE